jgi:TrmH family RNA methyltransferase
MIGRSHSLVRRLRALRRDARARHGEGLLVAEGLHLAREALASGAAIEQVIVAPRLERTEEGRGLLRDVRERGLACETTTDAVLASVQDARSPQPILMLIWPARHSVEACLGASGAAPPLVLVAHSVQDPGNLGALVRSADAAGAHALFATGDAADLHHPRAVRASMGSLFRLPAVAAEIEPLFERLAERGVRRVGADPGAGTEYFRADLTGALALVIGAEGSGLPPGAPLDDRVRIPLRRGVDSLNVAAAAAVLLFEAARQRAGPEISA